MTMLVVGDTHFRWDPKKPEFIEYQVQNLLNIIKSTVEKIPNIHHVVFLGDLFDRRQPYIQEILAVRRFLHSLNVLLTNELTEWNEHITCLRGNHDTIYKGKNSEETSLTIFNEDITVISHATNSYMSILPWYEKGTSKLKTVNLIPHYEDKNKILEALKQESNLTFGHFGYAGAEYSSSLDNIEVELDDFTSNTILGHLHKHNETTNSHGHRIITLGVPHPLHHVDDKDEYFLAVVGDDIVLLPHQSQIRFKTIDMDFLTKEELQTILSPLDSCLYVNVRCLAEKHLSEYTELTDDIHAFFKERKIDYELAFRYKDAFKNKALISTETFSTENVVDEAFLRDYAESNTVGLDSEKLMGILKEITDANKQT